jgi:hypothetical protein
MMVQGRKFQPPVGRFFRYRRASFQIRKPLFPVPYSGALLSFSLFPIAGVPLSAP